MGNTIIGLTGLNLWKPCLLPNDKAGFSPDWESRIKKPEDWIYSYKEDGGRVALIEDYRVLSRELKVIPSVHIQQMSKDFTLLTQHKGIIEAEFFAPDMTFAEIMHFFRTEDVTSDHTKKKYDKLWEKTAGGTLEIYKRVAYPEGTLSGEAAKKAIRWSYPGRDPQWVTSWHDSLQFYVFDQVHSSVDQRTKLERYEDLQEVFEAELQQIPG